jgi:hypothetical protein
MEKRSMQLLSLCLILLLVAFSATACKKRKATKDWETSAHADSTAEAFRHWDGDDPAECPTSCAKCHSTQGFIDFVADGTVDAAVPAADIQGITCDACHDNNAEALTQITFPSGETVTPTEASTAICGVCHQGRESGASQIAKITAGDTNIEDNGSFIPYSDNLTAYLDTPTCPEANDNETDNITDCTPITFRNVHYKAAAATLFGGLSKVGVEYDGVTYPGKSTHPIGDCAGCHNTHSGAIDVGRRGRNCNTCHGTVVTADDIGTLPGKATVANALALLLAGIESYAENNPDTPCIVFDEASYPYWFTDENCDGTAGDNDTAYAAWTPRLVKAAYNYQVGLKDSGAWAHNKPYILAILASSLANLVDSGYVNP